MSSDRGALPVKLYYRIGEVAQLVGVETHVLRYWELEFRSVRPQKSRSGHRVYSRRDVDRLVRIKDLLYRQGFTIAGARRKLQQSAVESGADADAPAARTQLLQDALVSVRQRVRALMATLDEQPSRQQDKGSTERD